MEINRYNEILKDTFFFKYQFIKIVNQNLVKQTIHVDVLTPTKSVNIVQYTKFNKHLHVMNVL